MKDKLDKLESEMLLKEYQILFDEVKKMEREYTALANEEKRRARASFGLIPPTLDKL